MSESEPPDQRLHCGIHVPSIGEYADPQLLVQLATAAEQAGWEGFFIWDHMLVDAQSPPPVVDPWVTLGAVAAATKTVWIGAMVTAISRRRPWKLAREIATLDVLSGGRVVFGAGLGVPQDAEFEVFGDEGDARVRAEYLDEGLQIIRGLLSGEPFSHEGKHFKIAEVCFTPKPVGPVPIWIAGNWPNSKPFRRAARWDGVMPEKVGGRLLDPEDVRDLVEFIEAQRRRLDTNKAFDVVIGGFTEFNRAHAADRVRLYQEAGATWWLERLHPDRGALDKNLRRIEQGPPSVG
ncbi:MAG TPA: LLM class flavin-dependent oxidoreductase [Gaiellales bacterium]|jgi:alkanesulfonate monooxygenase SsuD/methylene tetrahydromethanopterin reductase-like flavin-dependent oxidoreductase (luciferase family)|nr:LLM class flavin-dependent oxidoreductase [Gaiellales bacterium]